jgi:hypothetical protein
MLTLLFSSLFLTKFPLSVEELLYWEISGFQPMRYVRIVAEEQRGSTIRLNRLAREQK